jgi:predicted nucleotide-binding protein (sugar kinase/HSP70/actin superfamily)
MGNYYIPISYLIKKITKQEVIIPPKITKKTIELGSRYSPDYVCVPFKYNLGNYIEALNNGATILLQAGGGCRYGYYAELQEQILKDLGYNFDFINLIQNNHVSIKNIYKFAKKNNSHLNIFTYTYYLLNTILMIIIMDKLSKYPRENMGFEKKYNSFLNIEKKFLNELQTSKITLKKQIKIYKKYKKIYQQLPITKPKECIKIGLVGELYSLMEPYCSNNIEYKIAQKGVEVHRFTTLTYLLFQKKYNIKRLLKKGKKYIKYHLGADATESVVLSQELAKKKYDGIIHIKSFGCTPEINAMPILEKISNDYNIPIIYFSFDSQDNDVAIDTRLEAFYDMLVQKKITNNYKNYK